MSVLFFKFIFNGPLRQGNKRCAHTFGTLQSRRVLILIINSIINCINIRIHAIIQSYDHTVILSSSMMRAFRMWPLMCPTNSSSAWKYMVSNNRSHVNDSDSIHTFFVVPAPRPIEFHWKHTAMFLKVHIALQVVCDGETSYFSGALGWLAELFPEVTTRVSTKVQTGCAGCYLRLLFHFDWFHLVHLEMTGNQLKGCFLVDLAESAWVTKLLADVLVWKPCSSLTRVRATSVALERQETKDKAYVLLRQSIFPLSGRRVPW